MLRAAAYRAALCIVAAFCLLLSGRALAADDPFALTLSGRAVANAPDGARGDRQILFATVSVNGTRWSRLARVILNGAHVLIASDDGEAAGIAFRRTKSEFSPLDGVAGLSYRFDPQKLALDIVQNRHSDGPNSVDLGRTASNTDMNGPMRSRPLTALVVDYDLSASHSRFGTSAGALIEARLVRGDVAFESGIQFNSSRVSGQAKAVRLNTSLTIGDDRTGQRTTLGDFVSSTPQSVRALRMAGIQFGTDFGLRPDLVTTPLASFNGQVSVPTALDLIVGDQRFKAADIDAGDFAIRNIPLPAGRNQYGVVVRDALGRETLQTVSLYVSRSLLAKGLSQFAINAGVVRRNFGRKSEDYGVFAASGFYRRGITSRLTAEGSFEARSGFTNFGVSATSVIGSLVSATIDVRRSWLDVQGGSATQGARIAASVESVGRRLSLRVEAAHTTSGYHDLADVVGDNRTGSRYLASIDYNLPTRGTASLTAFREFSPDRGNGGGRVDVVRVGYRHRISDRTDFNADASYRRAGQDAATVLLGISLQLGARSSAQLSAVHQDRTIDLQASVYHPDIVAGDIGYSAMAATGIADRGSASLSYRSRWTRVEGQIETVNGQFAARANLRGSLIMADGALFAANTISGAVAIVKTGDIAHLSVERDNRRVGATGVGGRLVINDVPARVRTKIALDMTTAPSGVLVRNAVAVVSIPARAVALVDFPAQRYLPALYTLRDRRGAVFDPGTPVRALPSTTTYMVGYDGRIEINAALHDTEIRIDAGAADGCVVAITASAGSKEPAAPVLICLPEPRRGGQRLLTALP